ncbi:MAG: HipA domain-containing protein [Succinivibrio sp.]|nr:HipA domain-containing protein [Succinivibrio sp.]
MSSTETRLYAFLGSGAHPDFMGTLFVSKAGGRESFSFEFQPEFLVKHRISLDPDLASEPGRQYPIGKALFGIFRDSCPDRWGRTLLKKKEILRARAAAETPRTLTEQELLTGTADELRLGALRLKTDPEGPFESSGAAAPWSKLRELEDAAFRQENDDDLKDASAMRTILIPALGLGGARPKANVVAPDGSLWSAKFPSKHDEFDVGAWEMVAHDLASSCGLRVPEACLKRLSDRGATFLVKRFDREGSERLHFASAMAMLGKEDGDRAAYSDLADFLKAHSADPARDCLELWQRLLLNLLISNTDDHLRNHGFLLTPQGWRLSPLYDVNPNPYGREQALAIDSASTERSVEAAVEAAERLGVHRLTAESLAVSVAKYINMQWRRISSFYRIRCKEAERMKSAFARAGEICRQ